MRFQTLFEARWILGVLLVLSPLLSLLLTPWLALLFVLLIGYTFAFFRDPERVAPADPDVVVAAADGVVVEIAELEESEVVRQTMRRIAIFLSVFDVHTNRAPIDGRIIYREHREGLCPRRAPSRLLEEERIDDLGFRESAPRWSLGKSPARSRAASSAGRKWATR